MTIQLLHRIGHTRREGAGVRLPTRATHRQGAVFHDVEHGNGHIECLAALRDERIMRRQFVVTALALFGQSMINAPGRLPGLPERAAFTASLTVGRFTGGFAQRTGLLGEAVR